MTFEELQEIIEKEFGATRPADIAKELNVTPQVVSNWKSRNQVPYKYVQYLRDKITSSNELYGGIKNPSGLGITLKSNDKYEASSEISPMEIINFVMKTLVKNYIFIFILTSLIVFLTFIRVSYYTTPIYFATAKVIPQNNEGSSNSKIAGLAASFGISIPSNVSSISSGNLYPDIIKSRGLSRRMLKKKFDTEKFGKQKTLLKILTYGNNEIKKNQIDTLTAEGINALSGMINVKTERLSPVITISAFANEPKFTSDLVSSIIEELDNTQKQIKLSSVKEKKVFIEGRIADVKRI